MPKYRMKASVGWIYNSQTNLGEVEAATREEAEEAALEATLDRMDIWVEEVEDDDDR